MSRRDVCLAIAADCEADVQRYEGMRWNAKTASMIVGEQNAMISKLAEIVATLLPEEDE